MIGREVYNPISEELVQNLIAKTGVSDPMFFRVLIAYKFAQVATMMRSHISWAGSDNIPPNVYAMNLADSGFSKGKSVGILEKEVFGEFKKEYINRAMPLIVKANLDTASLEIAAMTGEDADLVLKKLEKDFVKGAEFAFDFASTTVEGLRSLRYKMNMGKVGSTNFHVDEIGSVMTKPEIADALDFYLESYDMGFGKNKVVKTEGVKDPVGIAVPANLLMFGTPSKLLDGDAVEKKFMELLETGYARRLLFGYVSNHKTESKLTPQEEYELLMSPSMDRSMKAFSDRFKALADGSNYNAHLTCDQEVSIKLLTYKQECESRSNDMKDHEGIKKAEMMHRYWKALKLAGAYAFCMDERHISEDNLDAAITLIEQSGEAFEKMMNRDKPYVRLAKYVASVERKITQVELIEDLPFYRGSESNKKEMMNLAIAFGYQNGIIIKRTFSDGVEFLEGERLDETSLDSVLVSYSKDIADGYVAKKDKFEKLANLFKSEGYHYTAHEFKDGHRKGENAIAGFNLIMIDVDNGIDIATAQSLLKGYKYIIHTTKRHTEAHNRFRIVFPMSHTLKLKMEDYKKYMKNVFDWLPFDVDEQTADIARKWETAKDCEVLVNLEGNMFPAMDFIPETKKSSEIASRISDLGSLDNLQRWFLMNIGDGSRNVMMHKYAMALLDKGMDSDSILYSLLDMNEKLKEPLPESEIKVTIFRTVVKEETRRETNQ
jgi:hypothetical protein